VNLHHRTKNTCNSNTSTPLEAARYKCDRRVKIREEEVEEVKDFTGSNQKKKERGKTGYLQRFRAKDQGNGPKPPNKNSGNTSASSYLIKIITNPESCESIASSNCSNQNPNPNAKSV